MKVATQTFDYGAASVRVTVNLEKLAERLRGRAALSKGGRATSAGGAVVVQVLTLQGRKEAARTAAHERASAIVSASTPPGRDRPPFHCPEGYARLARTAEADKDYYIAAAWYSRASGATIGHNRSAMYDAEERRLLALADAELSAK